MRSGSAAVRERGDGWARRCAPVVLALVLVTASCASGARRGDAARDLLRLSGSLESNPPRDGSEVFHVDTVAVPVLRAFAEVRRAYARLELPLSYFDADSGRMGSFVREVDEVDGEPASTYVDCGSGAVADPYADTYAVSLVVGTRVRPVDAETSTVETVIRARARARDVTSDLLRCRSFGALERRIGEIVEARADPGR